MDKVIVYLFPGQGSQVVGMGHDFARKYSVAADIFKKADNFYSSRKKLLLNTSFSEMVILTSKSPKSP